MLELILLAFLGTESNSFWSQVTSTEVPGIEILEPALLPKLQSDSVAPRLLSDPFVAVYAQDPVSGKTLFGREADRAQGIASLTKLMTHYVIRRDHDLNEIVTIDPEATKAVGASIDLYAREQLTVETLLEAILIPSANDAAVALAIWDAGSEAEFVTKMNQAAERLDLDSAVFHNASGLDLETGCPEEEAPCKTEIYGNQMSARDLMKLTRILLNDNWFRSTVRKDHFYGQSVDEEFFHEKASTNQLFGSFVNSRGVKTGYTPWAGQCFVNLAFDEDGNQVITVVLGSLDRFTETKHLVDWLFEHFVWQ